MRETITLFSDECVSIIRTGEVCPTFLVYDKERETVIFRGSDLVSAVGKHGANMLPRARDNFLRKYA